VAEQGCGHERGQIDPPAARERMVGGGHEAEAVPVDGAQRTGRIRQRERDDRQVHLAGPHCLGERKAPFDAQDDLNLGMRVAEAAQDVRQPVQHDHVGRP
jgi:hypothetical protein